MGVNIRWLLLIGVFFAAGAQGATITFHSETQLSSAEVGETAVVPLSIASINQYLARESKSCLVELHDGETSDDLIVSLIGERILDAKSDSSALNDSPTSVNGNYGKVSYPFPLGRSAVLVAGEVTIGDKRYAELLLSPIWIDSAGLLHQVDGVDMTVGSRALASSDLGDRSQVIGAAENASVSNVQRSPGMTGAEYVILTSGRLIDAFAPLVKYKAAYGYAMTIVTIENILAEYSGRDDAEKLRNYLKTFYAAGGKYVLLGGDGSVVPVRYAYPYSTTTTPALIDQLVCDLYFADMNGEWDADSDGIWGERYDDQPNTTPELLVGRLPVDQPAQVTAYVNKLIRYETDPGGGDPSYLSRALFFSADQMRDYSGGGQHGQIARAYPNGFVIDTGTAVESLSGNDPNPANIGPRELPAAVSAKYGIINVIAHGRYDGFVFKSSGYNEFPKKYVLSEGFGDIQCPFDSLSNASSPAFYYSLACDNGGFDLDRPPFTSTGVQMSRALLGSSRGAVAMVANSRWGWIGSSYLLQKSFFDSLFAHPDQPAIAAMYESQAVLWYYRDLVYGQVFLGDPTVRVYTGTPRRLSTTVRDSLGIVYVQVRSESGPESGATVIISDSGQIVATGVSGPDGTAALTADLGLGESYTVTAHATGTTVAQSRYVPSIVTDVTEGSGSQPIAFALFANYPNPCNPSTIISFDLPVPAPTTLALFNVTGQEVARLVDSRLSAGHHVVSWDGRNALGQSVASGVYFYRLTSADFTQTRKMALVR